jgi:hypothetical protein
MTNSINCPQCGLSSLPDQKFCRSCGASLQLITQPLADRATPPALAVTPRDLVRDNRQRARRMVLWGFILMFLGVATGVVGKKLMHDEMITIIGVLASLVGMFLTAFPYVSPPRAKKQIPRPAAPEVLPSARSVKSLPQGTSLDYVPSITERTTNLLKVSSAAAPKADRESQV